MSQAYFQVKILDSRRGAYLAVPDIERKILGHLAEVSLLTVDSAEEVIEELENADAIISWHHIALTRNVLFRMRHCRGVVRASVGYDNIDLEAATEAGILVSNVPDYGVEEVSDHTMALILALVRKIPVLDRHCREGGWEWRTAGSILRLRGATLGIVGLGRIGSAVARRAVAFGLDVVFFDPYLPSGIEKAHGIRRSESLQELLRSSQILSLHVPLTPETRGMIGRKEILQLPPGAIVVNTCRGEVIQQQALIEELESGHIGQAGLDVLEREPHVPEELRNSNRVLLTAHSAFYADSSLQELRSKAALAALRFLTGQPQRNLLNRIASAQTVTAST